MPIFTSEAPEPFRSTGFRLGFGAWTQPLLEGDAGIEQTIEQMRALVEAALHDPAIIRLATDIVRSVPAFDDYAEAESIYYWVRQNIRFTKDPVNKEKLYPPAELLKIQAGDCDDISMLVATLLLAVGYPARFVTVAASDSAPDQFSHVYVEGEIPPNSGDWIPLDPARFNSEFGVGPPRHYRRRWWSVVDDSQGDLSGAGPGPSLAHKQRLFGLGDYPRFRSQIRRLGQWDSGQTIATVAQSLPGIISAAEGNPPNPYGSFITPYTPGAGVRYAGYQSPFVDVSTGQVRVTYGQPSSLSTWLSEHTLISSLPNWETLLLGFFAVLLLRRI